MKRILKEILLIDKYFIQYIKVLIKTKKKWLYEYLVDCILI